MSQVETIPCKKYTPLYKQKNILLKYEIQSSMRIMSSGYFICFSIIMCKN